MVKVTKAEAFWLRDNGFANEIKMSSITHTKKYYMVEDIRAMKALNRYRNEHITYSSDRK